MLIDTHAHLTDSRLDAVEIISSMEADNLDKIVTVGYDLDSSLEGLEIARGSKNVYCSMGFHPSDAERARVADYQKIYELSRDKKVVAIGEIGLDYHYDNTDKQLQKKVLLEQIDLADQCALPVIFHLRDAYEDMLQIIKDNYQKLRHGAIMHCFSGSRETAEIYAGMDFFISFSGVITFANAHKYPDIIRAVPKELLLIETDCPYLAPHPHRGQTNYPKYVARTAQKMAEILGIEIPEAEELTSFNAYNVYKKMQRF